MNKHLTALKSCRMNLGPTKCNKHVKRIFWPVMSHLVISRSCSRQPPRRLNRPLSPVSIKAGSAFRNWRGSFSKINYFFYQASRFSHRSLNHLFESWIRITFACFCLGFLTLVRLNASTVYQTRHLVLCSCCLVSKLSYRFWHMTRFALMRPS